MTINYLVKTEFQGKLINVFGPSVGRDPWNQAVAQKGRENHRNKARENGEYYIGYTPLEIPSDDESEQVHLIFTQSQNKTTSK